MAAKLFEQNIKKLNFSFLEKTGKGGVLLTANYESIDKKLSSPEVLFALETAKEKFDADAVYFRYFNDGRGAVPQIYIYDNTNNHLTEKRRDIHIKVWSGCQVPMYIIIDKTEVNIFDAREKAIEDKENHAIETIKLIGTAIGKFSAASFDDGLFWEEESNKNRFQFEMSAYRDLITGLKEVYRSFQNDSGLDSHVALRLLVQCLLIKYLEERDGEGKSGYFAETYFYKNFGCNNFCEVIKAGKLLDLLDRLAEDFNGKIFGWKKEDKKEIETRNAIGGSEVKQLAKYLDGTTKNDQYVMWRLYSFSHLPVELISSVYEELLTNSKDIVYTPEMIVGTLVDECMPLKSPIENFKLIDVSCGSGIFLVKAYKRIIQWWRYKKWKETGRLEKPSLKILKQLLLDSIYGIDIQEDAIRLSVFSLSLALLDEVDLKPPVWQELKFPNLQKNICGKDFFKFISQKIPNDFDLVIGNPPFNLQPINGKEPDRKKYFSELANQCGYKSEIKIPDENPALHFLVQAMKLLKPDAMLCFIQPSGPLLYQKDTDFKRSVFSKYNLLQVIDFTKLSDVFWGKKNVATAAIFLQKSEPDKNDVVHIIANRTFSNVNRLFLEFDHYDFHIVNKDAVINSIYAWKVNLLGGGRLSQLVERLSQLPTLGEYLKQKRKESNWVFGDGFIKGKPDDELTTSDFEKKKGGYSIATFLTGSLCFEPEDFDENGIQKTNVLKDKYFQWPRQPELFQRPLLLIKKNIGNNSIPVIFTDTTISFKNEIVGIHATIKDKDLLKKIESTIKNNQTFRFYLSITSSRSGISRSTSTLLQEDILNIPFSEDLEKIKLSKAENLLIADALNYQLDNSGKNLSKACFESNITKFSKIFCQTLNSIYQTENKEFRLFKILDAGKYYAVHFEYTDDDFEPKTEQTTDLEQYIQHIIPTKKNKGKSSHVQRILKVYGKDCIILAKPKQFRYWLPSIALRDADEAFADYIKARYY